MKFDVTAIFFNSSVNGATATPPWCMSIGQGKDKKINQGIPGLQDILDGLIYKSVQDKNKIDLSSGSTNNEYLIITKFDKIFVNGSILPNISMIVLLVREHTKSHEGRLRISIPPYAKFIDNSNSFSNSQSYQFISDKLGCGSINGGGCWFVADVSVKNQEELHFECIVVDESSPVVYSTSQERSAEWIEKTQNSEIPKRLVTSLSKSNKSNYLTAIRTKPFLLLAGISGTGKSRIVRKLAQATVTLELQKKYDENFDSKNFETERWNLHRPANFELIQVKPNWHNSMDVVGYLSNIPSPHYVFTPFINFIVKAWQNPDVPFFLCLDEMNLAPVEEYFAEFLSAIESRSKEGDSYVTDPLIKPFNDFGKIENDKGKEIDVTANMLKQLFPDIDITDIEDENLKDLVKTLKTKGLALPQNLIVIGTVNMDETTFSFSRKVLDRAMSIEMNEVNYGTFLSGNTDDGLKDLVAYIPDLNKKLVDRPIHATDIFDSSDSDATSVINYLERINALLEGTPFKLGYRAANEALLYLKASGDFGNPDWRSAMDSFTLMKILSRIEGDSNKLRIGTGEADKERLKESNVDSIKAEKHGPLTILTALRIIIEEELNETLSNESDKSNSTPEMPAGTLTELTEETSKPKELESIKKLDSMISQLERERFVSYWN